MFHTFHSQGSSPNSDRRVSIQQTTGDPTWSNHLNQPKRSPAWHPTRYVKELDVSPPSVRSPGFALSALWQVAPVPFPLRFSLGNGERMVYAEPLPLSSIIHYPSITHPLPPLHILFTSSSFLIFFVCLIFVCFRSMVLLHHQILSQSCLLEL